MPDPAIYHEGITQEQADLLERLKQPTEDKGKAIVDDDADASGVIDKEVNAASSSSSSSQEIEINSSLIDQLAPLTLTATGKERPAIVPAEANAQIIVLASLESDQPGAVGPNIAATSAASKGKRKAEEAKDEAQAPPKFTKVTDITSETLWHNHEPQLFRDLPDQASTSSGLGQHRCEELMILPEEPPHSADPAELQEQVHEPEQISLLTFRTPTFGFDYGSQLDGDRVLIPFLDEFQVEDREELGVEGFLHQDHVMDED